MKKNNNVWNSNNIMNYCGEVPSNYSTNRPYLENSAECTSHNPNYMSQSGEGYVVTSSYEVQMYLARKRQEKMAARKRRNRIKIAFGILALLILLVVVFVFVMT